MVLAPAAYMDFRAQRFLGWGVPSQILPKVIEFVVSLVSPTYELLYLP